MNERLQAVALMLHQSDTGHHTGCPPGLRYNRAEHQGQERHEDKPEDTDSEGQATGYLWLHR